jgi:hypothetical protein
MFIVNERIVTPIDIFKDGKLVSSENLFLSYSWFSEKTSVKKALFNN